MSENQYELTSSKYNMRFKPIEKLQDIFGREYLICWDEITQKNVISKNYSVQTQEQKQDVRENMINFIKLNSISGICKIIAYSEESDQLKAVFEYDGTILGKYIQQLIESNDSVHTTSFINFYIILMKGLLNIVQNAAEIGMQFDDISRDNIIIFQPKYIPSSSSIEEDIQTYLKIFYDERQKDYEFLLQPNLFPERKDTSRYPNKLYWSAQKIYTQIITDNDYWSQEGFESIYQIGLLLLDIIYQCENSKLHKLDQDKALNQIQLLNPDQSLINITQKKRGYYIINRMNQTVQRDEAFIAHKLNFIVNLKDQNIKLIGLLIKNMIIQAPQMRYDTNQVQRELSRIQKLNQVNKSQRFTNSANGNELKINGENQKQIRSSYESQNSHYSGFALSKQFSEGHVKDSLKYSQNSLSLNEELKFGRNQPVIIEESQERSLNSTRKQVQIPLSSASLSPQNNKSSQNKIISQRQLYQNQNNQRSYTSLNSIKKSSNHLQSRKVIINHQHIEEQIWAKCRNLNSSLKIQLQNTLYNLHKINPQNLVHKQYSDGSFYYGCLDYPKNRRSGLGIYVYKVGDIYFGNWVNHSLPEGFFIFKNGESYIGKINKGKQGEGQYRYVNGNFYKGGWKDDLKHGKGCMIYGSGAKYEGDWVKGKKHGTGIYYYQNGLIYEGGFVLGKKYGNGVFKFPNGTKILGFWENNSFQGKAVVEYYNGDRFEGIYHQSQKTGQGLYKWKADDGDQQICYRGQFRKDNLEGHAIIDFQNGQKYEGNIKNGKRQGQGQYNYRNGDQFIGIWRQDQKQMGKYIFSSGQIFQGKFKNNQMGFGVLKYSNGDAYQGQFINGERHGAGSYTNKEGKIIFQGRWDRDQFLDQI